MKLTEARYRANRKYQCKAYEQIKLESRREFVLNDRIKMAAASVNMSKNAFLLYAIEKELSRLGYNRPNIEEE